MATRRIISTEKTILDKDDIVGNSPAASQQSDIKPAVPTYVNKPQPTPTFTLSPSADERREKSF